MLALWGVMGAAALHGDEAGGEELFRINCSACHLPQKMLVGPSLVEISTLYREKPEDFVAWCLKPGKKRKEAVQMPAMAHVPEADLLKIHAHILKAAEGLEEEAVTQGDVFADRSEGLKVQRIFMPQAGPAAIAVRLGNGYSLCWDAGECRLRYAWKGEFIDGYSYWKGNGNGLAKIRKEGELHVEELVEHPLADFDPAQVKFRGYRFNKTLGEVVFRYEIAGVKVEETYRKDWASYFRTFSVLGEGELKLREGGVLKKGKGWTKMYKF